MNFLDHFKKRWVKNVFLFLLFFALLNSASVIFAEPAHAQYNPIFAGASLIGAIGGKAAEVVGCFGSPVLCTVASVTNLWLKMMSWLVGFAGLLLNMILKYTIIDMKKHVEELSSINLVWKTLRDLANMTFIFILLYASIKTILGDSRIAKETIKNIVIVAIFINFSLFGTKVLIDASNVATMIFYSQIAPDAASSDFNSGLSSSFVNPLQLQTLYAVGESDTTGYGQILIVGFMGSIFLIVVAFVFLASAFFFLLRYLVLIIVLMFSPLAFATFILPSLKPYGDMWKKALSSQLIFAPVFMMFAWVTIVVINDSSFLQGLNNGNIREGLVGAAGKGDQPFQPNASGLGLIINFFLAIGLMITTLTTSKTISGKAGGAVAKATNWAANLAQAGMGASTAGIAGRFARGTIGREALDRSNDKNLQARAMMGGLGGYAARLDLAASRKLAKSSFDARAQAKGFGAPQKGGFEGDVKAKEKTLQEGVKNLATTDKEKRENAQNINRTKQELEAAQAHRSNEETRLKSLADTTITKSPELIAAEEIEAKAKDKADRIIPRETDAERAEKVAAYETARAEAERLRQEHSTAKANFVKTGLSAADDAVKRAENEARIARDRNQGRERAEKIAKLKGIKNARLRNNKWIPSADKVLFFGKLKRENDDAPAIIRKAAKSKTPEERFAEAAKELADKQAKEKAEKEGGGGTTPPAAPAAPTPPAPTPPPTT